MNQQLIIEIDQLLAKTVPTRIIQRGNAFARMELTDIKQISMQRQKLQFDGISLSPNSQRQNNLTLEGECYICEDSFREEEYELHVEIPLKTVSIQHLKIQEYSIDMTDKFILLKLKQ